MSGKEEKQHAGVVRRHDELVDEEGVGVELGGKRPRVGGTLTDDETALLFKEMHEASELHTPTGEWMPLNILRTAVKSSRLSPMIDCRRDASKRNYGGIRNSLVRRAASVATPRDIRLLLRTMESAGVVFEKSTLADSCGPASQEALTALLDAGLPVDCNVVLMLEPATESKEPGRFAKMKLVLNHLSPKELHRLRDRVGIKFELWCQDIIDCYIAMIWKGYDMAARDCPTTGHRHPYAPFGAWRVVFSTFCDLHPKYIYEGSPLRAMVERCKKHTEEQLREIFCGGLSVIVGLIMPFTIFDHALYDRTPEEKVLYRLQVEPHDPLSKYSKPLTLREITENEELSEPVRPLEIDRRKKGTLQSP